MISTWADMRQDRNRTWYRCSDLVAAAAAAGSPMNRYQIHRVLARLPKPTVKKYGHFHYGQEHLDAVVQAARRGEC